MSTLLNLNKNSQVSLWGGDAMFSNLDLRLDVLERELGLPFSFVSGHIHELHIHVPWTRLHAEPIVITINTIGRVTFWLLPSILFWAPTKYSYTISIQDLSNSAFQRMKMCQIVKCLGLFSIFGINNLK